MEATPADRWLPFNVVVFILYLDEAGAHSEASHLVVAGLAVFEREIHWYAKDIDDLQRQYFPENPDPVHFHAARLRTRSHDRVEAPWDRLTVEQRRHIKTRIYSSIRNRRGVLFGCAVEKAFARVQNEDPYKRAFEEMVSRFDRFLGRMNRLAQADGRVAQRGLLVLADSDNLHRRSIALLARHFNEQGTRWGHLHNVTDIPYFALAKDTRMLQYADFCANAIYGRYHAKLTGDFDMIAPRFDQDRSRLYGLVHLTTDSSCQCNSCFNHRTRANASPPHPPRV